MRIVIVGAGGHGKVVLDILQLNAIHEIVGFIDTDPQLQNSRVKDLNVLGDLECLRKMKLNGEVEGAVIAIGDNYARNKVASFIKDLGTPLISVIHPSSVIADSAQIGSGTVICAGTVVGVDSKLGDNIIINTGATVDHDVTIGANVHISPGVHLAGGVSIGDNTHVGIGASVIPKVTIGRDVIIGAGAVIIKNIPDRAVAVGVPSRIIRYRELPEETPENNGLDET